MFAVTQHPRGVGILYPSVEHLCERVIRLVERNTKGCCHVFINLLVRGWYIAFLVDAILSSNRAAQ
jgi:hypothetical protein